MGDVRWVRQWKGTGGGSMGKEGQKLLKRCEGLGGPCQDALGQVPCSHCHLQTPVPPLLTSMRLLS